MRSGLKTAEQAIADGSLLDCDHCFRPMTFQEYGTHCCDGLSGLNPLQEKLKKAKWKEPGDGKLRGTVRAMGRIKRPSLWSLIMRWLFRG